MGGFRPPKSGGNGLIINPPETPLPPQDGTEEDFPQVQFPGGGGGKGSRYGNQLQRAQHFTQHEPIMQSFVVRPATTAAQPLPNYRIPPYSFVEIRPLADNTGTVFVSRIPTVPDDDSAIRLRATDNPAIIPEISLLSELWIRVAVGGEGIMVLVRQMR